MLRLKQALEECGIQQKALAETTGFGKTQISLTLNSGKLPANEAKFRTGVTRLVNEFRSLQEWMNRNNLILESELCESIPFTGQAKPTEISNPALNELECVLYEIGGRAALATDDHPSNMAVIRMAQVALFLRRKLAGVVGHDAPWTIETEVEAAAILKGDRT